MDPAYLSEVYDKLNIGINYNSRTISCLSERGRPSMQKDLQDVENNWELVGNPLACRIHHGSYKDYHQNRYRTTRTS